MESALKELSAFEHEQKRIHSGGTQFLDLSNSIKHDNRKTSYWIKKKKLIKLTLVFFLWANDFASSIFLKILLTVASAIGVGCLMLIVFGWLFNQIIFGFTLGCLTGLALSVLIFSARKSATTNKLAVVESEIKCLEDLLVHRKKYLVAIYEKIQVAKSKLIQINSLITNSKESSEYRFKQRATELLSVEIITLSGVQFEEHLKKVFQHLGAIVRETSTTGDQGADLIVQFGSVLIAVQAKRYQGNVGNEAVQQAFSGMGYYQCDFCAVVTNSSFTRQAIELADKIECLLIDGEKLETLIQGELKIPGIS